MSEAQYDLDNRQSLRRALARAELGGQHVRMRCFNRAEADGLRAFVDAEMPEHSQRVSFSWMTFGENAGPE